MRELAARGWGTKKIARELGVARNTVRRYLRGREAAEVQVLGGELAELFERSEPALEGVLQQLSVATR